MIDTAKLSRQYEVRRLTEADLNLILPLYEDNKLFFQYCSADPCEEKILEDMYATPPDTDWSAKYYVGLFCEETLIAVLDLIDGYPEPQIAYIGLFLMNMRFQGKGIGSAMIRELEQYLKGTGKKTVRLAVNKGNPQAEHFWKKNGYRIFREVHQKDGGILLEAEKNLTQNPVY